MVTGSSRGIGNSIAKSLLEEGARVLLVARNEDLLAKVSESFVKKYGKKKVANFSYDLTKEANHKALKRQILEKFQTIDGVIANIGDGKSLPTPITSQKHWDSIWSKNFDTALYTTRSFLPLLKESKGVMIYVSSICGVEAFGAPVDYSVAKSALLALSKNLSRKVAPDVRVNVVAPGNVLFKGSTWEEKIEKNPVLVKEMLDSTVPMKRFAVPQEIADVVVFLASERASFITGAVVKVDGGQTHSIL